MSSSSIKEILSRKLMTSINEIDGKKVVIVKGAFDMLANRCITGDIEKEAEMQRFKRAETQIMVSTTVIEVGVDVPNASVMVIENAERFGLSQLHQLRGRVGRGADQSFCILVTGFKLSEDTRKRIDIMVDSNDGFEIAEADLKLRGPGDIEGTQQSGIAFDLRLANLARDGILIEQVRNIAKEIIAADADLSQPQNALLLRELKRLKKSPFDWPSIS